MLLSLAAHGALAAWLLGEETTPPRAETAFTVEIAHFDAAAPAAGTSAPAAATEETEWPAERQEAAAPEGPTPPAATPPQAPPAPSAASPPPPEPAPTAAPAPPPAPAPSRAAETAAAPKSAAKAPAKRESPRAARPAPGGGAPIAAPATPPRYGIGTGANPAPDYPRAARRAGWQGRVVLAVAVTAEGTASAVAIKLSSGHAVLDDAAAAAVRRWRFVPAQRGGAAVAGQVDVPIVFRLTD